MIPVPADAVFIGYFVSCDTMRSCDSRIMHLILL